MTDISYEMKEQSELEKLKAENARLKSALEEIKKWFFSEDAKKAEFDFFNVHGHRPFADQWGSVLDKKLRSHVDSSEKLHVCCGSFCSVCEQVKGSSE